MTRRLNEAPDRACQSSASRWTRICEAHQKGVAIDTPAPDHYIVASSLVRLGISGTLVVLVLVLAGAGSPRSTAATRRALSSSTVTPLCSLYVVTITTEVLITDFNSPKLSYNANKWPLLMAQARNARSAFGRPPLSIVLDRYDSLVVRLGVVGRRLKAGNREAAYAELQAARSDLKAVTAVAERAHLACRAGPIVAYIR
jgi:hypothetical protein